MMMFIILSPIHHQCHYSRISPSIICIIIIKIFVIITINHVHQHHHHHQPWSLSIMGKQLLPMQPHPRWRNMDHKRKWWMMMMMMKLLSNQWLLLQQDLFSLHLAPGPYIHTALFLSYCLAYLLSLLNGSYITNTITKLFLPLQQKLGQMLEVCRQLNHLGSCHWLIVMS